MIDRDLVKEEKGDMVAMCDHSAKNRDDLYGAQRFEDQPQVLRQRIGLKEGGRYRRTVGGSGV
jgi:hypothetical protein